MREKKTAKISFRLTPQEKKDLESISEELRLKPAEAMSLLLSEYIQARKEHGGQLLHPPKFVYFSEPTTNQNLIIAAEEAGDFKRKKKQ